MTTFKARLLELACPQPTLSLNVPILSV